MKPLLILAPSPARWQAVEDLLSHEERLWLDDLRQRLVEGVDGSQDAFAVIPDGAQLLASACIRRRHDVGVLGHLFTRPAHRQRGGARLLMQALLSWFDMTGGKWLYLAGPRSLAEGLFEKFGFRVLRRLEHGGQDRVTMLRTPAHAGESPFENLTGRVEIRDVARADWALLVALLQHHCGPDPRVSLEESALAAEATALELIAQQERRACRLLVACRRDRIVGLGSVATDQIGHRTYAMLLPHDRPPEGLREALLNFAGAQGYEQVDFPMAALAKEGNGTPIVGADEASPQ
ncbi:MAG: GNAT family N-acetyltransferase [Phycisphaerae bacterium]